MALFLALGFLQEPTAVIAENFVCPPHVPASSSRWIPSVQALSIVGLSARKPLLSNIPFLSHFLPDKDDRAHAILGIGVLGFGVFFPVSNQAWLAGVDPIAGWGWMFLQATGLSLLMFRVLTGPQEREVFKQGLRHSLIQRFLTRLAVQGFITWGANTVLFALPIYWGWISGADFFMIQGANTLIATIVDFFIQKEKPSAKRWLASSLMVVAAGLMFFATPTGVLPLYIPRFILPVLDTVRQTIPWTDAQLLKAFGYTAVAFSTTLFTLCNMWRGAMGSHLSRSTDPAAQVIAKYFPYVGGALSYGSSGLLFGGLVLLTGAHPEWGYLRSAQTTSWHPLLSLASILFAVPFFIVDWSFTKISRVRIIPTLDLFPVAIMIWNFFLFGILPPTLAAAAAGLLVWGSLTAARASSGSTVIPHAPGPLAQAEMYFDPDAFILFVQYTNEKKKIREALEKVIGTFNLVSLRSTGRFLDIGPGDGTLTAALKSHFHDTIAIEGSPAAAKALAAKDWEHFQVISKSIVDYAPPNGDRYDFILMSHMLYYLPPHERIAQLQRVRQWLTPTGKLVIVLNEIEGDKNSAPTLLKVAGRSYIADVDPKHIAATLNRVNFSVDTISITTSVEHPDRGLFSKMLAIFLNVNSALPYGMIMERYINTLRTPQGIYQIMSPQVLIVAHSLNIAA